VNLVKRGGRGSHEVRRQRQEEKRKSEIKERNQIVQEFNCKRKKKGNAANYGIARRCGR